ncbi:MAG: hypothetical protein IJP86_05255 [Synergistaceae bacterium]|nr:hypothetical protein [Synergistaceae bacterium]
MDADREKIVSWGEFLVAVMLAGSSSLDLQDVFADDESALKTVYALSETIGRVQEKALKMLARLMYGKKAGMFTLDEVFGDYVSNYRFEAESVEAVKAHALDMYNLLFDVVNALDSHEEHAELLGEIRKVMDEINSEQFRRLRVR